MFAALLLSFAAAALAGSPCPPRENIYPCSCLALPQGKRQFFTTVTCHRLGSADDLNSMMPYLKTMAIDHFYMFDSFWETEKLEATERENKQTLPADWLTLLKIKEIEIVDTTLSQCFACQSKMNCRNSVTTRFTASNSSAHEKICTLCDDRVGNKFSWITCMSKLRQFHFRNAKLTTIRPDLFPMLMRELKEVDLSHNQISKVEAKAFTNVPKLAILNLSHNVLESVDNLFSGLTMRYLEELDLSWNLIKNLGNDLIRFMPSLKAIGLANNFITELKKDEWKGVSDNIRTIDLQENALHCDCNIRWVNDTFAVHVAIKGSCASPEDYENSQIRKSSRMLIERCDEDGNIGTRARTTKAPSTKPSF